MEDVEQLEEFIKHDLAETFEVGMSKKLFVGGRVIGMLLGSTRFIGHDSVEDAVEEIVRAWVVVVKEGELRCNTVGNVLSERLKIEMGGEGGSV